MLTPNCLVMAGGPVVSTASARLIARMRPVTIAGQSHSLKPPSQIEAPPSQVAHVVRMMRAAERPPIRPAKAAGGAGRLIRSDERAVPRAARPVPSVGRAILDPLRAVALALSVMPENSTLAVPRAPECPPRRPATPVPDTSASRAIPPARSSPGELTRASRPSPPRRASVIAAAPAWATTPAAAKPPAAWQPGVRQPRL
jgi:hypothetical protein